MATSGNRQSSSREHVFQLYGLYVENLRHESSLYRHRMWVYIAAQAATGALAIKTLGRDSWLVLLLEPPLAHQTQTGLLGFALICLFGAVHSFLSYTSLSELRSAQAHLCEAWNSKYWTLAHSFGLPELADHHKPPSDVTTRHPRFTPPNAPFLPFISLLGWTALCALSLTLAGMGHYLKS